MGTDDKTFYRRVQFKEVPKTQLIILFRVIIYEKIESLYDVIFDTRSSHMRLYENNECKLKKWLIKVIVPMNVYKFTHVSSIGLRILQIHFHVEKSKQKRFHY